MKKNKIDFVRFIDEHQEQIFGSSYNSMGKENVIEYRKQIAALNLKMNEVINNDSTETNDPIFLLGLFAWAISQFGVSVKTDIANYKQDFLKLINPVEGVVYGIS